MNIQADNFQIEMTYQELYTIAHDIQKRLELIIDTHYIHHQQTWNNQEKERIYIIKKMFIALGRPELITDFNEYANKKFELFNQQVK